MLAVLLLRKEQKEHKEQKIFNTPNIQCQCENNFKETQVTFKKQFRTTYMGQRPTSKCLWNVIIIKSNLCF